MVSQPRPAIIEKSPFYELSEKYKVEIAYKPFIRVVGVSLKEFRAQRVEILTHTAVIFTSRTTVDSFFHICEEARITVPETMKYICQTEAVALYLQKYIVYRKRKISFADGSFTSFIELIIKHKDEKFLLALSEPHKPELPETLAKLKMSFDPAILARTVAADMDDIALTDYGLLALYSPSDVKTLVEASRSLGASWPKVFFKVIIPNLWQSILSASFISIAVVLGEYTVASLLGRMNLQVALYQLGQSNSQISTAMSLLALLFGAVLLVALDLISDAMRKSREGK